ncbi:MAG: hypothetical protein C4297_06015 [Gemmataceae bacterium]
MSDEAIVTRVWLRETASLLKYLDDAWPWTPPGEAPAVETVHRLAAQEQEALRDLAAWMMARKWTPPPTVFPEAFSSLNYTSIDSMLPRLVAYQRWTVVELEKDLAAVTDAGARLALHKLLEVKQRTLGELENLARQHAGHRAVLV